jgi:STE24 endopeptidase
MQLVVLAAFAVVIVLGSSRESLVGPAGWPVLLPAMAAYLAVSAILSVVIARGGLRRLERGDAPLAEVLRRQHRRGALLHGWLLGGLTGLMALGLCQQVRGIGPLAYVPLADEAAAVGVFLLACLIYWRAHFPFEQAVRWQVEQELMLAGRPVRAGWTLGQYLDFQVRSNFLFRALPLAIILFFQDAAGILGTAFAPAIQRLLAGWNLTVTLEEAPTYAATAILPPVAVVVFFLAPVMLVRVWRTRRLGDGELRTRLEGLCRKIGVRFREILVWDTHGVVVNAGVMGVHRSVRYVLISDALLEQMDDAQVLGVLGHEAGHVVHHHIAYLGLFSLALMLLVTVPASVAADKAELVSPYAEVLLLALLLGVWGPALGWLSRRFERQADLFGAWCSGLDAQDHAAGYGDVPPAKLGAPLFAAALENVARLNGVPRETRSLTHGSIAARVSFLLDWAEAGGGRAAFDRSVSRLKLIIWAALIAGVALVAVLEAVR